MNNKMGITTYISIITLNVNGLNDQKIYSGWMDKKTRLIHMLLTGDPLQIKRHTDWK